MRYPVLFRVIDEQSLGGIDGDLRPISCNGTDHLEILLGGEEGFLLRVYRDDDGDPVKNRQGALDDIDMSQRDWIETAWVQGVAHALLPCAEEALAEGRRAV